MSSIIFKTLSSLAVKLRSAVPAVSTTACTYSTMTTSPKEEAPTTAAAPEQTKPVSKMIGRDLYNKIGQPKTVVAPMVDQSELAWRILSRKYGADLCYTPMYHARLFGTSEAYRNDMWGPMDGDEKVDRPLVVQFCANKPDELLAAAKLVQHKCDAVDLNLGCPQGIAKRGHYGSFLMEDWDLIYSLINILHKELDIPVTAKIRVYDDREKTLAYAKMVLSAGAQFLTVHGRTREMKGQKTGLADWNIIKYLRDNLPPDTVMIANGNLLYQEDIQRSLTATCTDAVMSAESNLHNPALFNINKTKIDDRFPRVDKLLREYFEIAKTTPGAASATAMKSHFFKLMHAFLPIHTDIRNKLGSIRKGELAEFENIVEQVEAAVAKIYEDPNIADNVIEDGEIEEWGGSYKEIPYWRCQPYFRTVNGIKQNGKRVNEEKATKAEEEANKKQKVEENPVKETQVEAAKLAAESNEVNEVKDKAMVDAQ